MRRLVVSRETLSEPQPKQKPAIASSQIGAAQGDRILVINLG